MPAVATYGEALYGTGVYSTTANTMNPNAITPITWETDDFGTWTAYLGWNGAGFIVLAETGGSALLLDDPDLGLLNEAILGPSADGWTDLGCDLLTLDVVKGASNDGGVLARAEAGSCQIVLSNIDATYEPFVSGSFPLGLGTRIAVLGHDRETVVLQAGSPASNPWGNFHRLFLGQIESVTCTGYESEQPVATIVAVDDTAQLQNYNGLEQASQGAGDTTEERINRILENSDWALLDPGTGLAVTNVDYVDETEYNPTHQATTLAQPAWEMLLLAADAANRVIYFKGSGQLSAEPIYPSINDSWTQWNWSCEEGAFPLVAIDVAYDKTQLINVVDAARTGGSQVTVEDPTSIARHGAWRWGRNDLTLELDADVESFAGFILNASSEPAPRVTSLRVVPSVWPSDDLSVDEEEWTLGGTVPDTTTPSNAWSDILDFVHAPIRAGYRHRVTAALPGTQAVIDDIVAFRGVSLHLDADVADIGFVTSTIRQFVDVFILDDDIYGLLDHGHRLA